MVMKRMDIWSPIGAAITRSRILLFERGSFMVWFRFGFIAFLASLASGSGNGGGGGGGSVGEEPQPMNVFVHQAEEWMQEHTLLWGTGAAIVFVAVLFFAWVGSRGQMMMIHTVATGDVRVRASWRHVRVPANSVFAFRAVLWCLIAAGTAAWLLYAGHLLSGLADAEVEDFLPYLWAVLPGFLIFVAVMVLCACLNTLLNVFVSPLMYRFELGCLDGWRAFWPICRGNVGPIALLFIVRLFYYIAFAILALFAGVFTVFLGFLPVIHHTIFAPFYVFDRAYTLYAIESLGPEFRMIVAPECVPAT